MDAYVLETKIGDGSFGQVYKGYDKTQKRPVAIKIIDLEKVEDELDDIQQEIRVLSDCDCDQLCRYFGSFIVESKLWIIMELVEFSALEILLSLGPLDETYICVILHELLLGLEYLHRERKIHRDIKAANVLCSKNGAVKLADFGVTGQLTDSVSKRQTFVGTPFWMAPEVITQTSYDHKADIWSLGITAIELAKGAPPHAQEHPMKAVFRIPKEEPPTLDGDFSRPFKDFVSCCLQLDPEARPCASELLRSKFIKAAKGTTVLQELIQMADAEGANMHAVAHSHARYKPNAHSSKRLSSGGSQKSRSSSMSAAKNQSGSVIDSLEQWDFDIGAASPRTGSSAILNSDVAPLSHLPILPVNSSTETGAAAEIGRSMHKVNRQGETTEAEEGQSMIVEREKMGQCRTDIGAALSAATSIANESSDPVHLRQQLQSSLRLGEPHTTIFGFEADFDFARQTSSTTSFHPEQSSQPQTSSDSISSSSNANTDSDTGVSATPSVLPEVVHVALAELLPTVSDTHPSAGAVIAGLTQLKHAFDSLEAALPGGQLSCSVLAHLLHSTRNANSSELREMYERPGLWLDGVRAATGGEAECVALATEVLAQRDKATNATSSASEGSNPVQTA